MNMQIVSTTDGNYVGEVISNLYPIMLDGVQFIPDRPMKLVGDGLWRFSNSNYSIDAQEI